MALRTAGIGVAAIAFTLPILLTTPRAGAVPGGCTNGNSLRNRLPSHIVDGSFTVSGTVATYRFDSLVDRNPSNGVPGLIAYCIYPNPGTAPDSVTTSAVGANGERWEGAPRSDTFSFKRPHGNPSNIELDGTMGIVMGTATWNGGVPADQTLLFHINDAAECDALYGEGSDTCWVLPGSEPGPTPSPSATSTQTSTPTATPSSTPTGSPTPGPTDTGTPYPGGDISRAGAADAELDARGVGARAFDPIILAMIAIAALIISLGLGVARASSRNGPGTPP